MCWHGIAGVGPRECLWAASISGEAVTPPLVGRAFKELLLFSGVSAGKSTADGTISGYWFWALSAGVLARGFRSGPVGRIVILAGMNLRLSVNLLPSTAAPHLSTNCQIHVILYPEICH